MHETLGDGYITDGGKRIYADEDIGTGRDATQFRHQEANSFQEEICNVIRSAGIILNSASETVGQMVQLNQAIDQKISVSGAGLQSQITSNDNDIAQHTAEIQINSDSIAALDLSVVDINNYLAALVASQVNNDSSVTGSKVKDALNTLKSSITALVASAITNDSSVVGAKVKDALNTLLSTIGALLASNIGNNSTVAGATVKDALNTLKASLPTQVMYEKIMTCSDFINDSSLGSNSMKNYLHTVTSWGWPTLNENDALLVVIGGTPASWTDSVYKSFVNWNAIRESSTQIRAIAGNPSVGTASFVSSMKVIIRLFKKIV